MLLEIIDLFIEFHTMDGITRAVNGVSFSLSKGEILGIVGESGSGKSVATHAITKLLPIPPGKIVSGEILFKGRDLLKLDEASLNKIRGKEIGMIFQEPMTSLNPVFTVENQMSEVLKIHFPEILKSEYQNKIIKALEAVGIPEPRRRLKSYPHELSGGLRQRVMIAMSLLGEPDLLIADEPTTALDVTIQAQILEIINNLRSSFGLSVILITHDLGVIAEVADKVAVMYAGRIVESGTVQEIFDNPQHPYTRGLLASIPSHVEQVGKKLLKTIRGVVPDLRFPIIGCPFYNRCDEGNNDCTIATIPLKRLQGGEQMVACVRR